MDTMLDALEGREDVLPDLWISELEEVEECFGAWEMDGERVVLEGRLRLDDLRHHQTRREELEREREKTVLVLEQERSVREAEQVGVEVDGVMERAEETERGLREAIEANEVVAEGIELGDDIEGAGSPVEGYGGEWVGRELLMKLESVEKMRMARSWSIGSETETEAEWVDANEERVRISRGGSITDASGARRHGISLDPIHIEKRWSGISTGSTPYMTPMPTSWFVQNGYVPENHFSRAPGPLLYPSDIAPARSYPIQHPVAGQMHPTATQLHPAVTQAYPATTQTHPSTTKTHPAVVVQNHPAVTQTHPSVTQIHPSVTQSHPAVTQIHPSTIQTHPATIQTHPSVTQSHPAVVQIHPSTIQLHPSVIQNHPAATQQHPSTTQLHPAIQIPTAPPQTPSPKSQKERSTSSSPKIIKELPHILAAARSFFKVEKRQEVERELDHKSEKVLAAQIKAEEKERLNYEEEEIDRLAELEAAKFFEECERAADAEVEEEEGQWADEEEREREEQEEEEEEKEEERNMVWKAAAEHGLWAAAGESLREQIAKRQKAAAAEAEAEAEREEAIEEAEFRQRIATVEAGVTEEVEAEHQETQAEAERKRRASLERVSSLEAARLSTEAEHQRLLAEEAAFIVAEERQRLGKEREAHSEWIIANQEEEAAERTRLAAAAAIATAVSAAAAEVERRRHRYKEGGFAAAEVKRIEAEAGRQRLAKEAEQQRKVEASRLAAVAAARLKAEAEADRQRRLEVERLAALEAVRLAAEAEKERQKLVDEEAERQRVAASIEAERQRLVDEKAALVSAAQQAALVEAAETEEKKRAAEAEAERKRLIDEEAEKQRGLEIEPLAAIEAENQRMATLEAERQRAIEEESRRTAEAQAEVARRAEQKVARKRGEKLERLAIEAAHVAEEEAERLRVIKERAERLRLVEIERLAALEAAHVVAEEEAQRQRVTDQQKAEAKILASLAAKEAELEQQARLAADSETELKSRQNLALAERERQLLAIQEAERLKMEREIEEARIKAEIVKEEDERRRQESLLAAEKHTGSNSEGGSISGDDVTEEYPDVTRVDKPLPPKDSDEDSEGDRIRLLKSHTNQPSVPPPSAEMTPVTSRSSSAQGSPQWSFESPKITLESAKATQEVSDGSSDFDSEVDLVAAENRAAHDSLQKALSGESDLLSPADEALTSPKDSAERELPRAIRSPGRSIPEISFTEVPSVFVAPSTPQNPTGFNEPEHTHGATVWSHSVNSPVFDDMDSFGEGLFPSDMNIDENRYQELENYGAEDNSSDFDVMPIVNSTPKPARRLGRLSGLDSITEVLTPHTPHDQYFKASDGSSLDDDDTPSKRGKRGDLALPDGFSRDAEDSDGSPSRYSNDMKQWSPIPLDMSSARPRSSMSNKVCLPIWLSVNLLISISLRCPTCQRRYGRLLKQSLLSKHKDLNVSPERRRLTCRDHDLSRRQVTDHGPYLRQVTTTSLLA